ncbi:MAG: HAD hydrolase family protein [Candidatus Krumholzibacteria bacterium]|jgi:3-deoxy-D-manno-octulosonate 8-phosphate phosphatase (KDO 8-P phosphatase)|nr:HAD hydrolase family protein [Candidatus Krumholzibacteria bacterium]MDP6669456.1 HAD hydrolase family protein [Candidatus Krumholzibacteria bacterium]MDP6797292.1 HAD hydrolase family protein [Candidatus Krumholzibacteria bacterium]MDP7021221.1 HAD hydrolase family protein [Candidatus Krumholzibacteria bacterium]
MPSPELLSSLRRIRLFIFDVDGVLTDGSLSSPHLGGGRKFHVHDGFGFYLSRQAGLSLALCSGKDEQELRDRAEALKVDCIRLGRLDKGQAVREILEEMKVSPEEAIFVGDDLFDLPGMREVGLSAAPANARPELLDFVDWKLDCSGGRGAAREVIEAVLKAQDLWDGVCAPFLGEDS